MYEVRINMKSIKVQNIESFYFSVLFAKLYFIRVFKSAMMSPLLSKVLLSISPFMSD